jgi:hypothetical protein
MDYRKLLQQWHTDGVSRNEAVGRLYRENECRGRPISDHDVFELIGESCPAPAASAPPNKTPSVSQDVTEETERQTKPKDTEEIERDRTRVSESEGSAVPPPRKRTADDTFRDELEAGVPSTLPFPVYVPRAVEEYIRQYVGGDLPEWQGVFHFVRLVKAHPSMANESAKQAFRATEAVLRSRSRGKGNQRRDCWEASLGAAREDVEATFLGAWDSIRYLPGRSPLGNAMELAKRYPLILDAGDSDRRPDGYALFISLAGWLQVGMGNQPIKLPCREVADLLHVQPMTVSRYRKWALEDEFLEEVKAARFAGKRGAGEATSFRFDVSLFPILEEAAQ